MSLCVSLKAASERMTYNITETCHYVSVLKQHLKEWHITLQTHVIMYQS